MLSSQYPAVCIFAACLGFISCHEKTPLKRDISESSPDTLSGKYSLIEKVGSRIRFEKIPEANIVSVHYTGSYQTHLDAFPKLISFASRNFKTAGTCLGIYPFDPDAVKESKLEWEVGIRIVPGAPGQVHEGTSPDPFGVIATPQELSAPLDSFKLPSDPFQIKTMNAVSAITLTTDVEHAGLDGLAMSAWLTVNGYVQTEPTRMEFAMMDTKSPMTMPVKIEIPVVLRKTGLKLSGK